MNWTGYFRSGYVYFALAWYTAVFSTWAAQELPVRAAWTSSLWPNSYFYATNVQIFTSCFSPSKHPVPLILCLPPQAQPFFFIFLNSFHFLQLLLPLSLLRTGYLKTHFQVEQDCGYLQCVLPEHPSRSPSCWRISATPLQEGKKISRTA